MSLQDTSTPANAEQQPVEGMATISREEKARLWAELDGETGATPAAASQPAAEPQGQAAAPAASEAAAQAAAEPAQEAAADPYAGLPAAIRDEIVGLKTLLTQVSQRQRNVEGHIGGLNSRLSQMQQAAQTARAAGEQAPSAAQVAAAQGDTAAMQKLVEDYPEFGAAVKATLDASLADVRAQLAQRPAAAPAQAAGVTPEQLAQMRSELTVEARHEGWQDLVKTPTFNGWLGRQPRERQMLAASDKPADAIRLLDLYKDESKPQQQQQQRLAAAAAIPEGRHASAPRAKPIEQMSRAEYWAYLDQLDKTKAA